MLENRKVWQDILFSAKVEGGYSNRSKKADPGGPTMGGITLSIFRKWSAPKPVTIEDLKKITDDQKRAISAAMFWIPVNADKLPGGVDIMVADFAFHSGPRQAVKTLQRVLGFDEEDTAGDGRPTVDGWLGTKTLNAIAGTDPHELIEDYSDARLAFMQGLPNWEHNKNGWPARLEAMTQLALHIAPKHIPIDAANRKVKQTDIVSNAAIGGVGSLTILPWVVEAMPAARSAYQNLAELLGPYAVDLPALIPILGAVIIAGIIAVKVRAKLLAQSEIETGNASNVT